MISTYRWYIKASSSDISTQQYACILSTELKECSSTFLLLLSAMYVHYRYVYVVQQLCVKLHTVAVAIMCNNA
jgi:hypothetical protein